LRKKWGKWGKKKGKKNGIKKRREYHKILAVVRVKRRKSGEEKGEEFF
jgi:hypothetical protein